MSGLLTDNERTALRPAVRVPGRARRMDATEVVCETRPRRALDADRPSPVVRRALTRGGARLWLLETIHEYASRAACCRFDGRRPDARSSRGMVPRPGRRSRAAPKPGSTDRMARPPRDRARQPAGGARPLRGEGAEQQLALAVSLSRFWYVRGYLAEGRGRLEHALEAATDQAPGQRRRACTAAASFGLLQGDHAAAIRFADEALAAARQEDDARFVANALSNLGAILLAAGDRERAGPTLEEAVERARAGEDERIAALAINNLGDFALTVGDYERAEPLFRESLALLRARGDIANVARSLFNNGAVDLMLDRAAAAADRFHESLALCRTTGDREDSAWSLLGLAATNIVTGNGERGASLLGAARTVLDADGRGFQAVRTKPRRDHRRALAGATRHLRLRSRVEAWIVDGARRGTRPRYSRKRRARLTTGGRSTPRPIPALNPTPGSCRRHPLRILGGHDEPYEQARLRLGATSPPR